MDNFSEEAKKLKFNCKGSFIFICNYTILTEDYSTDKTIDTCREPKKFHLLMVAYKNICNSFFL